MKIHKMTTPNCLVYSAASVLDVEPEAILDFIGPAWSELWFENKIGDKRMRGVHMQEIIDFAVLRCGKSFFPIDWIPLLAPDHQTQPIPIIDPATARTRMLTYMKSLDGLLITKISGDVANHACAWDHDLQRVLDPAKGERVKIDDYPIIQFWALANIRRG